MSIAAYYTKLKRLWDEYNAYSQILPCTCGLANAIAVEKEKEKQQQTAMTRGATIVEAAAFAASKNNLKAVTRSNNGPSHEEADWHG
ncbi:hypothetical protein Pint_36358 [Pistacia integerrima]|uniref:Uncharacterized protein n=1 Tax=Pistacia integerrima TaxID=434235 RepID=A0ACC0Y5U0_9ROSI|nr:hypothetical protein Pint_36358 [Pistacia integerrima]